MTALHGSPAHKPFNLTRYFFVLSFVLMVLVAGVMTSYLRHYSNQQLIHLEKTRASSLVQVFENSLWQKFKPLTAIGGGKAELMQLADQADLRNAVVKLMRGTDVIKLKVYSLSGRTIFSSDVKQVGEDKSGNSGFLSAAAGTAVSELTHRNSFDAFEHQLADRDVISTYVPVHGPGEQIEGVLELYVDATPFVRSTAEQLRWLALAISGLLILLYLAQMLVVRFAARILDSQARQLTETNRELDTRVEERTRALSETNAQLESEIQERRGAEQRLDRLAHHDPLTGLPNRLMFMERLRASLARAARHGHRLAVLFIDLDRFKHVNDTLGHFTGDQLLIAVTARLKTSVRQGDTLARLGGDEFVCILEEINNSGAAGVAAEKLLALFREPFVINGNDLFLSASIGLSFSPDDGSDVETLVRNADIAMYQAKASGRNRSQFYSSEMSLAAEERMRIESNLRRAIAAGEIEVHFQPKVDSRSNRLIGAEALARWTCPVLGVVPPVRFIPVAEETGLIVALGDQVLEKTCRQLSRWRREGFDIPCVSVNLSVKQLERAGFSDRVQALLQEYELPPSVLELEITESVIMAVDDAFAVLDSIRQLGVGLSIDDFGTGYSSLAYLKRLPIQVLKIDRAFVIGIGESPGDEAIIRTIVALAESLGLKTVAEGVEDQAQVDFLKAEGCCTIQGYRYGRPLPAGVFANDWRQWA
ncbi:MAG: EAL domain-containing protein [Betaproteobacteria bacterium]